MINASDVTNDLLTKETQKKYSSFISAFQCSVLPNMKQVLVRSAYAEVTTVIFLHESKIAAFCTYRCSQVKLSEDVAPAIEIVSFAVNDLYRGTKITVLTNKQEIEEWQFSRYILESCVEHFRVIKNEYIYAKYIVLHAVENEKVTAFYSNNGFSRFDANLRVFFSRGSENRDYWFIRTIE